MSWKVTQQELMNKCFGGQPDPNHPNILKMLKAINYLRDKYAKPLIPSCFYRTPEWDIKKGRSGKSQHCQLLALDINDPKGEFALWCMNNLSELEKVGLYMENPQKTIGWVHVDFKTRQNRIFEP